jgi:hypothetical protein
MPPPWAASELGCCCPVGQHGARAAGAQPANASPMGEASPSCGCSSSARSFSGGRTASHWRHCHGCRRDSGQVGSSDCSHAVGRAARARDGLRLFSDLAPQVAAAEAEVAVLVAAERAGCPLPRRLQFAVDILRAREAKARQAREAADQATSAAEAAEAQRRHSAGHGGRGRGAGSTPGTTAGRGRGAAAAGMAPPAGAIAWGIRSMR